MGYALFRVTGGDCTSECSAGVYRRSTLHESIPWVVSTRGENVCWWNVSMERELKGVPRRGPIVRGNMTGAKGSEVGGENVSSALWKTPERAGGKGRCAQVP